jgi:hypothetical protein
MQSMPNMYQYSPLSQSSDEIRLLQLPPGSFYEDVRCKLEHVELVDSLQFTALSYTWGDPTIRKKILIDSHVHDVTINLYDALQHMRDPNESRTFWIDALCINQEDLDERSKQVLRMRDIYSMATKVEVWLGKSDTNGVDAGAIDLVGKLGSIFEDPEEMLAQGSNAGSQELFLGEIERSLPTAVKAMADLYQRPWWTRVWVVQELSLAKQDTAIVRVGRMTSPWLNFLIAAYAIESSWFIVDAIISGVAPEMRLDGFLHGIRMAQCRRINLTDPGYTLLELLNQHRDCEATNPRDKLYGILGLAGDVEDISIMPDYTATPENIFIDLFKKHVTATGSLDMICACRHPRKSGDLPSWVPDWSTDQTTPGICINDRYVGGNDFPGSPIAHFQKYAASGSSASQVAFTGDALTGDKLCITAIPIGKIVSLGDVDTGMQFEDLDTFGRADENGKSGSDSEIFNQWLNMVLEDGPLWDSIAARYGAANVLDGFCRTLVGDRNNKMVKPPEIHGDEGDVDDLDDTDGSNDEAKDDEDDYEEADELVNPENSEASMTARGTKRSYSTIENDSTNLLPIKTTAKEINDAVSISTTTSTEDGLLFSPPEMLSMSIDGFRATIEVCWGKRFAILDSGHIGVVQQHALIGDIVAVVLGCTMPLVLRRIDGCRASFVCESYFHGGMDGEVMETDYTVESIILE